jgi:hypothetical protein
VSMICMYMTEKNSWNMSFHLLCTPSALEFGFAWK